MTTTSVPLPASIARPAPERRGVRARLFVPAGMLRRIVIWSFLAGVVIHSLFAGESLWLGVGVGLSVFVAWHALVASRTLPWVPGLIALMACIQWVLAPWAIYHLQTVRTVQPMPLPADEYFAFAVPAALCLVLGLYLPLRRQGRQPLVLSSQPVGTVPTFRATCESMVFGGLLLKIIVAPLAPGSIAYAAVLLSQLSFVGAFGLLIARTPGWHWRVALVMGVEMAHGAAETQFLDMLTWTAFAAVMLTYRFRLRLRVILPLIIGATVFLLTLNGFKAEYREAVFLQDLEKRERPALAFRSFLELLTDPARLFSKENIGFNLSRLNEGWIMARVLIWVPNSEPYARGETVINSARASLVPRILDPDKAVAGGFENFPRFTGLPLIKGTSMNIGMAGEMYANFGLTRGLFALFAYGWFLGWIFARFARSARRSPLWWAWAPYVLLSTVSAEMSTAEVFNQLTKSVIVMFAVITFVPGWVMLRRWRFGWRGSARRFA